jgi:hypothetical protein
MGLLGGWLGDASESDAAEPQKEFGPVPGPGERIERSCRLTRDLLVFTGRRLALADERGLTGSKVEYHSIPCPAVTQFVVEPAGHLDLEAEPAIRISGRAEPIRKRLSRGVDVHEIQGLLAVRIAG